MVNRLIKHALQALQDENPEIQRQAAEVLRYLGNQAQIVPLTQVLNSTLDRSVKLAAIEALGAIGGEDAETALLSVPRDGDPLIRWTVDAVLDQLFSGEQPAVPPLPPPEEEELVTILH